MKLKGYRNEKLRVLEEKVERRTYIQPFLQAERDLNYLQARQKELEVEEYLMRDNPDWEVGKSVFNTNFMVMYSPRDPKVHSKFIWD